MLRGMDNQALGNNIKNARTTRGLSQGELAEKINARTGDSWSQTTIYKIEKGVRPLKVTELFDLATVLEIKPEDLLKIIHTEEEETILNYSRNLRQTFAVMIDAIEKFHTLKSNLPDPDKMPISYVEKAGGYFNDYRDWYKFCTIERVVEEVQSEPSSNHPSEQVG